MKASDAARLVAAIKAVHPRWPATQETAVAWASLLEDVDGELAMDATRRLLRDSPREPTPADIREAARVVARERAPHAVEDVSSAELSESERAANLARLRELTARIGRAA